MSCPPRDFDIRCVMFDRYCKRVLHHARINYLRTAQNLQKYEAVADDLSAWIMESAATWDEYPSSHNTLQIRGWQCDIHSDLLYNAMRRLDEILLVVLYLSFWCGLSDEQIAEALQIPRRTVNYRKNLALERLRDLCKGSSAQI